MEHSRALKKFLMRTPLRAYLLRRYSHRYTYMFDPSQLCFLCSCIEKTRDIPGIILEIGCAVGQTTVFLNKLLDSTGIEKDYVCLDTFSGFVERDIVYETSQRAKSLFAYSDFMCNSLSFFNDMMKLNQVERVRAIEADAALFDFASLDGISFCLLDIDLYLPVKAVLPKVYGRLSPGGVIVVDDCDPHDARFDGAHEAFQEFVDEYGVKFEIVHRKLGVLRKP